MNFDRARRTPLYEEHARAGAKLVAFAGWSMPLHYGSQIEEHHAVRRSAGVFNVSHMGIVDVSGEAAVRLLRGLLANDPGKLKRPGTALYSCLLDERAGILDDVILYRIGESDFRLVVNAATRAKDLAWLAAHAGAPGLAVTPREDLGLLAVQGPQAAHVLARVMPLHGAALGRMRPFEVLQLDENCWAARTGYTGEDGWELMAPATGLAELWRGLLGAGAAPCGLGARDTLRLEAGLNLYGQDMDETVNPLECGLGWTVALEPAERDFVGRKALEQAVPRFRRAGLVLEERAVLRAGQPLATDAGAGTVTSGGFSPTLGRSIGLARVPSEAPKAGWYVEIRGKSLPVRCVDPPFVRYGRVLVS